MHDSKVRSRLKAQLSKFTSELCGGLSKPLTKFVSEMLYGIQSSQDVKLSNIGRALGEAIPLIRTEKRLSRNLKHAEIEAELTSTLVSIASSRICEDTVLALDLSDIRKEFARKMEYLATVWDGSTGETHPGYWLVDVTGAEVNGSDIVPVCQKLFSTQAKESLTDAGVGAAESVAARKGLSELLKWSSIASTAGVLLLAGVFVIGYWLGFDHGRARGFNAGVEGHLASSWALSADGLRAYELWKGGDLEHLIACDRPGWKLESGVCYPKADEGKLYGWRVR